MVWCVRLLIETRLLADDDVVHPPPARKYALQEAAPLSDERFEIFVAVESDAADVEVCHPFRLRHEWLPSSTLPPSALRDPSR